MANYGIKVTLDGYDISTIPNTAANIKKFAMLSGVNLLKIRTMARVAITNNNSTEITHSLGYIPIAWVFMANSSGNLVPVYDNISGTNMYVTSSLLRIYNLDGATRNFYYYIFYDSL